MLPWGAPSFSCGAEMFPIDGEGVFFNFFFWSPPNLMLVDGEGVLFFLTFFLSPPQNLMLLSGRIYARGAKKYS